MNTLAAFFILVTIGGFNGPKFHGQFKSFAECQVVAAAMNMTHDGTVTEVCIPYDSARSIGYNQSK